MTDCVEPSKLSLVLASSSPRRKELLASLGIPFTKVPSSVDESMLSAESPESYVTRLAKAKAEQVAGLLPGKWVLGADTIVVIDGTVLGKPVSSDQARNMLHMLSGREHFVFTAYALVNQICQGHSLVRCVRTTVRMRSLSRHEISAYVLTGEPMDKAGSYAIQGMGAAIVSRVEGSYTNVVGLPLCEVAQDLQELGIFDFLGGNGRP